jgi:hypothetical protein
LAGRGRDGLGHTIQVRGEGLAGASGLDQPLYLFDAAEAMIFDGPDFELAVATSADWTDASSQFHTGFAEDSSLVRAIAGRDFALKHVAAAAMIQGATYHL